MSYIITSQLFSHQNYQGISAVAQKSEEFDDDFSKKLAINHQTIITYKCTNKCSYINKMRIDKYEIMVHFKFDKLKKSIYVQATLINDGNMKILKSKEKQLLAIKELSKRQKQFNLQASMYIFNGRIVMVINDLYKFAQQAIGSWIQIYNKLIYRNMHMFIQIAIKYIMSSDYHLSPQKRQSFLMNLAFSRNLYTLSIDSQISQSLIQYNYKIKTQEKQRIQLQNINRNILIDGPQKSIDKLYAKVQDWADAKYIKDNLMITYNVNYKKLKLILAPQKSTNDKKSVLEYIYNFCKIQLLENIGNGKPIAQGGKFYIYVYTSKISLVQSSGNPLQGDNQFSNKIERIVALKKIKPQFQKKRQQKVQHENNIVMKLRASTSPFFPKYFGVPAKSQFNNFIIMEHIEGQQLDSYVTSKRIFLSFWNKIYLFVNIVNGLRILKAHQIVHLDLKPINILIAANLVPKIIDYGQSYHKQVCNKEFTPGYTFPYVAPEVYQRFIKQMLKKDPQYVAYSQKQDVFALGIILSEIFFQSKIFQFNNLKLQEIFFKKQIYERYFLAAERCEMYGSELIIQSLIFIIQKCLNPIPQKRPTLQWIFIILKIILNLYISSNK